MIDLHNDALLALPEAELLPYLAQAKQDGMTEIWLAIWTTELSDPLTVIKEKKAILERIADDDKYPLCRLHIEDAWFLTPENLDEFIALQPHSVGLTWNATNNLAGGAFSKSGITSFGYQVIKQLEAADIQIDTAHLNRKSFWQFAKVTTRPLVCTHTAFQAVHRHKRNLTDRQIRKIVASGGKVGLCLVPKFLTRNTKYCGFHHIIKHIAHFKKHFGTQNLYLGSDFYGTDTLPYGVQDYGDLGQIFHATIIGYSYLKQPIIAYQFGDPYATKRILITGGMHAREWITCAVVQKLKQLCCKLPPEIAVAVIPNCNPDGTRLAQTGLTPFFRKQRKFLLKVNHDSPDFALWKANARAVDLNVNFDALWGQGDHNCTTPAPANYIGKKPHSEPETQVLLKFIAEFQPTLSLAFHSKGEVIYYSRAVDADAAQTLSQLTKYQPELSAGSYGGLTDYLALTKGIPALTIEVGADELSHPIGTEHLPAIMAKVGNIIYFLMGA